MVYSHGQMKKVIRKAKPSSAHFHIEHRDQLSQFPQISSAVAHLLNVAQKGGLPENVAESIYYQLMDVYRRISR